jgi:hypothetical protein
LHEQDGFVHDDWPGSLCSWRATSLGVITKAVERRLVLDMMAQLAGIASLMSSGGGVMDCVTAVGGAEATGVDPDRAIIASSPETLRVGRIARPFLHPAISRMRVTGRS